MKEIMQCQNCKHNTATIHLTEITEGDRSEAHLCELCAQKQGLTVKSQIPLNELLSNLLAVQPQSEADSDALPEQTACPHCGITLKQIRQESLLGCPYDYEVFEQALLPVIEKAHDSKATHCGKIPSKATSDTKKQVELLSLRQKLRAAVENEDYETAAKLRDRIQQLQ